MVFRYIFKNAVECAWARDFPSFALYPALYVNVVDLGKVNGLARRGRDRREVEQ